MDEQEIEYEDATYITKVATRDTFDQVLAWIVQHVDKEKIAQPSIHIQPIPGDRFYIQLQGKADER